MYTYIGSMWSTFKHMSTVALVATPTSPHCAHTACGHGDKLLCVKVSLHAINTTQQDHSRLTFILLPLFNNVWNGFLILLHFILPFLCCLLATLNVTLWMSGPMAPAFPWTLLCTKWNIHPIWYYKVDSHKLCEYMYTTVSNFVSTLL